MQGLKVGLDLGLAVLRRVLELHRRQLVQDVAHGFANNRPKEKKMLKTMYAKKKRMTN